MKCGNKNCGKRFTEIKFWDGLKYFCSFNCKQEYLQEKFSNEKVEIKKKPKPIKQISDKKRMRLKEGGSEKELFKKIWDERLHLCDNCQRLIRIPKAHNFDHIKSKGSRPDLRLEKDNIRILCFKCHFEKTTGLKYKGIDMDL